MSEMIMLTRKMFGSFKFGHDLMLLFCVQCVSKIMQSAIV